MLQTIIIKSLCNNVLVSFVFYFSLCGGKKKNPNTVMFVFFFVYIFSNSYARVYKQVLLTLLCHFVFQCHIYKMYFKSFIIRFSYYECYNNKNENKQTHFFKMHFVTLSSSFYFVLEKKLFFDHVD